MHLTLMPVWSLGSHCLIGRNQGLEIGEGQNSTRYVALERSDAFAMVDH